MRNDSDGLFWTDTNDKIETRKTKLLDKGYVEVMPGFWAEAYRVAKGDYRQHVLTFDKAYDLVKNQAEKRTPPEPVWLEPTYLPGLQEALEFNVDLFTDDELVEASFDWMYGKKHELSFDIECYANYFLVAFKSVTLGKVVYFEMGQGQSLNLPKLRWVLDNFLIIGFNSNGYDVPMLRIAFAGANTVQLKVATASIIEESIRPGDVVRQFKGVKLELDHVDLMEVAPLRASLKIYGGRLNSRKMQDLPFAPNTILSPEQIAIVRLYCINDLDTTIDLRNELRKELDLRVTMSNEYGLDLRSKSDAQIAEAVIRSEIEAINHTRLHSQHIEEGTRFRYRPPEYFKYFQSPEMQGVVASITNHEFTVGEKGKIGLPEFIKAMRINIGNSTYKMGIGGLHSSEKKAAHYSSATHFLVDRDVTSYYPFIILTLGLYPENLGPVFLTIYRSIVERRIGAKVAKIKSVAETLKIVINGSFGKLGQAGSVLYSPSLLIQVTITGQLALLLLIEQLELAGIPVVSANTDGVVIKCPRDKEHIMDQIVAWWEQVTQFETEATYYKALFSRDVNNYLAVVEPSTLSEGDDRVKTKGIFSDPGLKKNPQNFICVEAVINLICDNIPIEKTIRECRDISKFLNVRTVKGGAVRDGVFLGKAIRWYYAENYGGEIVYALTGNKVPKSEGAKPIMELSPEFPNDIDYAWYIREAEKLMVKIGAYG